MISADSANSSPFYYLGPEVEGAVDRVQSFTQRHRGVINGIILGSVASVGAAVLFGAIMGVDQSPEAMETNHSFPNDPGLMEENLLCRIAENIWKSGECVLGNLSEACVQIRSCLENVTAYGHLENGSSLATVKNVCQQVVLDIVNLKSGQSFNLNSEKYLLGNEHNSATSDYHVRNVTSCRSTYGAEKFMPERN